MSLIQIVGDLATQVQYLTLQVAALKTVEPSPMCHVATGVTTIVTTSALSTSPAWPNINDLAIPVTGAEPVIGGLQAPPRLTPLLTPVPGFWVSPAPSGLVASSPVPATNPVSPPKPAASRLGEQFLENPVEANKPEKSPVATTEAVLAQTGAIPNQKRQAKDTTRPTITKMTSS
ncbi:calphotin-like [Palaemon carinicauda]|uniref:calphotin-like n=1 Tax=Palaemon carinicauda TaxID=392227 RepID=UPI0035B5F53C